MLLLAFTLISDQPNRLATLVAGDRLPGDILNGWIKRWLLVDEPGLATALRPADNARALYALRVSHTAPGVLAVLMTLCGDAAKAINPLVSGLLSLPFIELGPPRCAFAIHDLAVARPVGPLLRLLDPETGLVEAVPQAWSEPFVANTLPLTGQSAIDMNMVTPPRVGKTPVTEVPTLRQWAKTLARKLAVLEPESFATLQLDTSEWYQQERALADCHLTRQRLEQSRWRYHSANQRDHSRRGWTGTLRYEGPIGDKVVRLLWLGQWIGLGQNACGGQGMYDLQLVEK